MGDTQPTSEKNSMEKEAKNNDTTSSAPSLSTRESAAGRLERLQSTAASVHQEMLEALADLPHSEQAQACQNVISQMIAAIGELELRVQAADRSKQQGTETIAQYNATMACINEKKKEDVGKKTRLTHDYYLAKMAKVPIAKEDEVLKLLALQVIASRAELPAGPTNSFSHSNAENPDGALKLLLDSYPSDRLCTEGMLSTIVKFLTQKLQNLKKESKEADEKETVDDVQNTPSTSGPPSKKPRMSSEGH